MSVRNIRRYFSLLFFFVLAVSGYSFFSYSEYQSLRQDLTQIEIELQIKSKELVSSVQMHASEIGLWIKNGPLSNLSPTKKDLLIKNLTELQKNPFESQADFTGGDILQNSISNTIATEIASHSISLHQQEYLFLEKLDRQLVAARKAYSDIARLRNQTLLRITQSLYYKLRPYPVSVTPVFVAEGLSGR